MDTENALTSARTYKFESAGFPEQEHGHKRRRRDVEAPAQWMLPLGVTQLPETLYRRLFGADVSSAHGSEKKLKRSPSAAC